MALSVEASELLEHFQWLTEGQSRDLDKKTRSAVMEELADVQIYLIRLADILSVDLSESVEAKLLVNAEKYPAQKVRGSALKYTQLSKD
jgi:NTP pyrophosphatase (non-canonical NTP hydrolase)